MSALFRFVPLALEGQWHGAAAVALVLSGAVIFMGSIYVLLAAIYGWRQGYMVLMASIAAFLILLSGVWLFGIPGTIPGFGPRGTEPHWVPFLPDSEQGQEFAAFDQKFPNGGDWRKVSPDEVFPGQVTSAGEIDGVRTSLAPALAGYFQRQGIGSPQAVDPLTYSSNEDFRLENEPITDANKDLPVATIRYWPNGDVLNLPTSVKPDWLVRRKPNFTTKPTDPAPKLLFGISIPKTANHPAITVFAYRNKGRIFQPAAMFFGSSIVIFAFHLWLLARYERKQKLREASLSAGTAVPANA